ncbi:MAG: hypothetical protein V3T92_02250, partial [Anaerolineae bacterium]
AHVSAEKHPLTQFFVALAAGMVATAIIAGAVGEKRKSARAAANAADPKWIGHENDEWCWTEYNYETRWYDTWCVAYDGELWRTPDMWHRCDLVRGWC